MTMIWTIEFLPDVRKELKKLDRKVAARIVDALENRIATLQDPRTLASPLKGQLGGYWRWRVGDHRVIGRVEDERITILVIRVAHRREVYR